VRLLRSRMGRSRRDRPCPEDENLAEAGPEAAPARHRRRRLPAERTARDPLRQWLGAKCEPNELRRWDRVSAAVQADGGSGRSQSAILPITIFGAPENLGYSGIFIRNYTGRSGFVGIRPGDPPGTRPLGGIDPSNCPLIAKNRGPYVKPSDGFRDQKFSERRRARPISSAGS
jgi:hypothetical protein